MSFIYAFHVCVHLLNLLMQILLFDIIQVHDDATDQSVFKLKLLYEKEDKGVMSVVASIEGYLLLAIGPKVNHRADRCCEVC